MQFNYEPHTRTGKSLLKSDEELIETLEENQVQYYHVVLNNDVPVKIDIYQGAIAKFDDIEIYCVFLGTSVRMAKETVHC